MGTVTKTLTLVPSGNTGLTGMSISGSYPVTNAYTDETSTSYARYSIRQSTTGSVYFTFDTSDLPESATITSVTAKARARVSSTTRVTNTKCQLYTGTTAKGSNSTFATTSNPPTAITLTAGTWTRSELNDLRLFVGGTASSSSSSRYIYFYGASVTITYTVATYDVTISNSTSATITANPAEVEAGETSEIRADTLAGITVKLDNTDITSQFTQRTETPYTIEFENRGTYGFALNGSGYYQSANKGVDKSCSVCRVNLDLAAAATVTFQYINYAEATYDFGVFGNIDVALTTNYYPAGSSGATISETSYRKACNTSADNTSSVQTLTYSVSAGEHFIDVKYSKDDGSAANNDTLQFKVTVTMDGGYTPATYYGYDISNVQADHTVLVTTSGGGPTLYVKLNGSWVQVQRAYKKQNGSWSQVAVNQAFSSGTNYKQG